jgi:Ca2+-binding EF-hand superfamily protein
MQVSAVSNGYPYGLAIGTSGLQSQQSAKGFASLASKTFSDLDTDGDGSISKSELASALSPQDASASSATDQRAAALLKKIDADGDGKISPSELAAFQTKIGRHHHHRRSSETQASQNTSSKMQDLVNQVYKSADANGDGQLTKGELGSWLQNAFGGSQVNVAF